MNNKARVFIKNFLYTLIANITSLLISTLLVLVVPKLIGVEGYGYWQLYLFYSTYVGFFQFGWNDGIYLRYGGKEYRELHKNLFFSQFWMLVIFQLIIGVFLAIIFLNVVSEKQKLFILLMVIVCMLLACVRSMLLLILQATNRIKEYARITIIDRILCCLLIICFLLGGIREYRFMILADLIGKFISLLYAMYECRDIVFCTISKFYLSFTEAILNINVGIKLMFANIASNLIIGVVRFGIEHSWSVSTFGKVSLTLSISNLMMLFIDAVGIVMFPVLRRTNEKNLPSIYKTMRVFLMVILFGVLIIYYPLKVILSMWLPNYTDSLVYMALVFPMCIYEGKMALLINTYLKILRKEKLMLKINLISLVLSMFTTFITTIVFKNINLAVISIVFILAFRCVLSEVFLSKILQISYYKDIILELLMTLIFILISWFIHSWIVVLLYGVVYIIHLIIKRKDIKNSFKSIKLLVKQ